MKKLVFLFGLTLCLPLIGIASDNVEMNASLLQADPLSGKTFADFLWLMIAGFLVFFMQAGFALVEAGFTRAKNVANIMMKNMMDFALGTIVFWAIGFSFMYGESIGSFIGFSNFFLSDAILPDGNLNAWMYADWFFQAVFAATAATIISGAMAERTNFIGYLAYTVFITGLIYPIVGHWIWGGGWLSKLGFHDFAGSTVVHSVGAWAGLVGTIILGPRIGRYLEGKAQPIKGHSVALGTLGVFILWFGWFGFNPGSTLGADFSFARIAVTTNMAAAAGATAVMFLAWFHSGKPDLGYTLNGALAGLVAITAPCAVVSPGSAFIIGTVGGVIMYFGTLLLEKAKVDDPVGAIPVHGMAGTWGTLSVGLFAQAPYTTDFSGLFFGGGVTQLGIQLIGILAVLVWTVSTSFVVFKTIDKFIGLRVTEDVEISGLDHHEHGTIAYPEFFGLDELSAEPNYIKGKIIKSKEEETKEIRLETPGLNPQLT
ncbi:ammonium transporter [bacterium]|nr:MAG: ammonium transporter [bacterium]